MAKQIKSNEIYEKDIFQNLIESANEGIIKLEQVNTELVKVAKTIKTSISTAKFTNTKELTEFVKATKEATKVSEQHAKTLKGIEDINKIKKTSLKELNKLENDSAKINKQLQESTDEVVKAKIRYQKATAEQKKILADEIILNDKNAGTLEKLMAQNRKLRREREKLNLDTKEGADRLKEINDELDANNDKIKENSDKLKQQTLNVGNYTESIQEATGELGGMIGAVNKSVKSIGNQIKAFRETAKSADTAGKKMRVFGTALKASGIGIIVALLGAMTSALGDTREGASAMEDTMQKMFSAIRIIGQKALLFFEKIGLNIKKAYLEVKDALTFGTQSKEINKELAKINKQLGEIEQKSKQLDIGEQFGKATKNIDAYRRALWEFENQTAKTISKLVVLRGEEERLSERTGDMTLSFRDQLKAQTQYNAKVKERIEVEKKLADLQLNEKVLHIQQQLIEAGANYNKQQIINLEFLNDERYALKISSERLSALAEAKSLVAEKDQEMTTLLAKNAMERRNTEKDLFEKQLDYAIDAFDVNKTINERIINLETTTLAERERITEETRQLSDKAYANQIKLVQDYTKQKINFDKLIALQDEEAIRKELDKNNLNETTLTRILEIIKERKIALQDLSDLELETANKRLEMNKAILESEQNVTADNIALELEKIQYKYDKELALQNDLSEEKGILYKKDYEKLKSIINNEIELKIKQLEQEAKFKKESLDREIMEEEERAQKKKEIDEILSNNIERIRAELNDKLSQLDKEKDKEEEERKKQFYKNVNDLAKASSDYFVKQSQKRIEQIDKEINALTNQQNFMEQMAVQGNLTAQKSLAQNQKLLAEANVKKEKELKKQERIKLAESVFSTYIANLENKEGNALVKTISDISVLTSFINSLPTFYEGTDTTVAEALGSPQMQGKDGYIVRVDGSEKVLNPELSKMTGNLTTYEIAKISSDYLKNKGMNNGAQRLEINQFNDGILIKKIDELNATIKNKPETNIEMGEILGGVIHLIESQKKGNDTIRNIRRFN